MMMRTQTIYRAVDISEKFKFNFFITIQCNLPSYNHQIASTVRFVFRLEFWNQNSVKSKATCVLFCYKNYWVKNWYFVDINFYCSLQMNNLFIFYIYFKSKMKIKMLMEWLMRYVYHDVLDITVENIMFDDFYSLNRITKFENRNF